MSALVCTTLYPASDKEHVKKGVTLAIRNLIESAKAEGLDVSAVVRIKPLIGRTGPCLPRKHVVNDIEVYDLPLISFRHTFLVSPSRLFARLLGIYSLNYDTIVSHISGSFVKAEKVLNITGVRHVFVAHATDIKHPYTGVALSRATKKFARSIGVKSQLEQRFNCKFDGVIGSGLRKEEILESHNKSLEPLKIRVIFAGNFIPLKNLDNSLRALAKLKNNIEWHFHIYGNGPLLPKYKGTIEELRIGKNVTFHGFCNRNKVLEAMKEADIFLMPSAPETFGLAFLEAMGQGCVVIGHQEWGIDGLIKDGYGGFLVGRASPYEIFRKVEQYLYSDRERLHREALSIAQKNTTKEAGRAYKNAVYGFGYPKGTR